MTYSLCDASTVALLSLDAHLKWNEQGQVVRQAAQGLSLLVNHNSQEYMQ
jgi:hypothetical protein